MTSTGGGGALVTLLRITKNEQSALKTRNTTCGAASESNWTRETDQNLLRLIASGTSEQRDGAYIAFYQRHAEYLFAICYDLANRYKFGFFDEKDLFSLTMSKARESADTFKPEADTGAEESQNAADAWLGGIAKRVVFDLIRRIPKCVALDPQWLDGEDGPDGLAIRTNDVFDEDETEDVRLIREAIDTLSQKEKEVIWAASQFYRRRNHQHTPTDDLEEIVDHLGITKDNFRKIKQRAKAKILQFVAKRKRVHELK